MRLLIVHAHPEPRSFTAALRDVAVDAFRARGDDVVVSDLYAMGWQAAGGPHDVLARDDPAFFGYQREQRHAAATDGFAPDVAAEIARLQAADGVIFHFPLWWFSMPAILKGWIDRVFAIGAIYEYGRSYETGMLAGRRAMLSFTTGGPPQAYQPGVRNGDLDVLLWPIHHGMLRFVGLDVLRPFVAWSAARADEAARAAMLASYRARLATFWDEAPMDMQEHPRGARWLLE